MRRLIVYVAVVAALLSSVGGVFVWGTVAERAAADGDTIMWGT
jgi:hypothetical protein